jgi:Rrf2 family protein
MATLKKAGFVKSLRGAAGGYVLAKPPEEITVGGVLRALEGATLINCDGAGCGEADCNGCVTKSTWAALNARLETAAESITLLDICNQDI